MNEGVPEHTRPQDGSKKRRFALPAAYQPPSEGPDSDDDEGGA